jgi:hypothetical protein
VRYKGGADLQQQQREQPCCGSARLDLSNTNSDGSLGFFPAPTPTAQTRVTPLAFCH